MATSLQQSGGQRWSPDSSDSLHHYKVKVAVGHRPTGLAEALQYELLYLLQFLYQTYHILLKMSCTLKQIVDHLMNHHRTHCENALVHYLQKYKCTLDFKNGKYTAQ